MTPEEHHAEADRLLQLADDHPVIRLTGDVSMEDAARVRDRFAETTGQDPIVVGGAVRINNTALVLAALTHAVLSLKDPSKW